MMKSRAFILKNIIIYELPRRYLGWHLLQLGDMGSNIHRVGCAFGVGIQRSPLSRCISQKKRERRGTALTNTTSNHTRISPSDSYHNRITNYISLACGLLIG